MTNAPRPLEPASEWFLLRSEAGTAAENMAWDEALLESASVTGRPVLRFYGWREPAATFGYFQKFTDVEKMTALRPLIRRPTGGGLVPHDADWTYSAAFPPGDSWYELPAIESYRRIHRWIERAFEQLGFKTELAPVRRQEAPGQCFIGAEQFDLLHRDRKIAGAAQRRTRNGLLIQGSIQPPLKAIREEFEQAFCDVGRDQWAVNWTAWLATAELKERALELARLKYSQALYNERR